MTTIIIIEWYSLKACSVVLDISTQNTEYAARAKIK